MHSRRGLISVALAAAILSTVACRNAHPHARPARAAPGSAVHSSNGTVAHVSTVALAPNEMGRIPILEYHLIGDADSRWGRQRDHFRRDLELLYTRGYRPITVAELVDGRIDIPAGTSPVVVTFDDASPSQFRYLERGGSLEVDPSSGVGIWLDFHRTHSDWRNRATFCVLPGAAAGHAFFGDRGTEGQHTSWRLKKVRFLAQQGFELCDHTLWHADLVKYPDAMVEEQIARGALAIDSAVPGYRVRTFALPLGVWPKNRALAERGSWRDPKSGRTVSYAFSAILEVSGVPVPSPHDPSFNPLRLQRIQVVGNELDRVLDQLDRTGARFVSDGDPATIARPRHVAAVVGGRSATLRR